MRERLCHHQETYYATNLELYVSRCGNSGCDRFALPISKAVCSECPYRIEPNGEDTRKWASIFNSIGTVACAADQPKQEQARRMEMCQACSSYNEKTRTCGHCKCPLPPIDELVRYTSTHCPKELW